MDGGELQLSTAASLVAALGLSVALAMLMLAGVFGLIDRLGRHGIGRWHGPLAPRHRH